MLQLQLMEKKNVFKRAKFFLEISENSERVLSNYFK